MEEAAHKNLGTHPGCQRPEKHVPLSKSTMERSILRHDEQTPVLKKVSEVSLSPSKVELEEAGPDMHTSQIPGAQAAAAQAETHRAFGSVRDALMRFCIPVHTVKLPESRTSSFPALLALT